MNEEWNITQTKVDKVIEKIIATARPRRLILFGSFISGNINTNSDLDILVVTDNKIKNFRHECVRIRRELKGISMPLDILVISESKFDEFADIPGLIYREALRTGKVVYVARK